MRKTLLRLTSILGALGVIIGAFGAHGLKPHLSQEAMDTFQTGVQYHFVHALALFGCTVLLHLGKKTYLWYAGWAFAIGIFLFSGSLYLLSLQEILAISIEWLGPVTPVGGVLFIVGWAFLFLASYQKPGIQKKRSARKRRSSIESA